MKVKFTYHTGYCGSDAEDIEDVFDDCTDKELDTMAWEGAVQNAASYGYELCSDDCEDEECEMEHPGSTNIEGNWIKVTEDTEVGCTSVD